MRAVWKRCTPVFLLLLAFCLIDGGLAADIADARSKSGGKSFSSTPSKSPASGPAATPASGGGFGKGLMGGLLGGAIGGMLFGSMFGAAGSGMGILPLLLLAVGGFFLYRKFARSRQVAESRAGAAPYARQESTASAYSGGQGLSQAPAAPAIGEMVGADGVAQLKQVDRDFDERHFLEVATDVFFQVQAGWMRRDLDSYRHLLGEELAREYEGHLAELRGKGHINKLESIAVRDTAIAQAGSDGHEDFVTVLFTANLLDYTVDERNGELVSGSATMPVKFREEWTWARPTGTQQWRLEGVREV
jgi:predicted lipid-binding transport protein (Tim44 family)